MLKQPVIGPFIKDFLTKKKISYPYEIWNAYDDQRKENHKSIKYYSFIRYIYMMEQLGLIMKAKKILNLKRTESKSKTAPDEWYRQYYKINPKLPEGISQEIWDGIWNRPQKYYRLMLYSEDKYGTLKGEETKREYEAEQERKRKERELIVPTKTTTIKVSQSLLKRIKQKMRPNDTYNSFLVRELNIETKKSSPKKKE